jgi:hypothetical protein
VDRRGVPAGRRERVVASYVPRDAEALRR